MYIKGKCTLYESENILLLIYSSVTYFSVGEQWPGSCNPWDKPRKLSFQLYLV